MKICKTLAAASLTLATTAPTFAVDFGYTVATDNFLYEINLTTGVATRVTATQVALAQVEGLAFLSPGVLIGIGGSAQQRQIWNLATPPGSFMSQTNHSTENDAGLAAYQGTAFTVQGFLTDSNYFSVNPNTGANILSTSVALGGGGLYADSMGINAAGDAFIVDPIDTDSLYRIDRTTAVATLVGSLSLGDIAAQSGLDFTSAGILHLLLSDGATSQLYSLNTTTGAASAPIEVLFGGNSLGSLGGFAIGDVNAVAAVVVPEPTTMTLAMLGLTALTVLRRERR